jgi:hypothetical protein
MVELIRSTEPVYQTYWYGHENTRDLLRRSRSLAIYRDAFGGRPSRP